MNKWIECFPCIVHWCRWRDGIFWWNILLDCQSKIKLRGGKHVVGVWRFSDYKSVPSLNRFPVCANISCLCYRGDFFTFSYLRTCSKTNGYLKHKPKEGKVKNGRILCEMCFLQVLCTMCRYPTPGKRFCGECAHPKGKIGALVCGFCAVLRIQIFLHIFMVLLVFVSHELVGGCV